jgi:hypothetical protein
MAIKVSETVFIRITHNDVEIDAHWNYFNDAEAARAYFNQHVVKTGACDRYGFVIINKQNFEF